MAPELQHSNAPAASGTAEALLDALRRYWWITAAVLLVALGATFALTKQQTPTYAASTSVLLRTNETVPLFPLSSTGPEELRRTPDVEQLYASSPEFTDVVGPLTPEGVTVAVRSTANELVFNARGEDPEEVAQAANLWAQTYVTERHQAALDEQAEDAAFVQGQLDDLVSQLSVLRSDVDDLQEIIDSTSDPDVVSRLLVQKVSLESALRGELAPLDQQIAQYRQQLSQFDLMSQFLTNEEISARVVQPALVPGSPDSPNLMRNMVMGAMLGLALGVALPYARYSLVDRISGTAGVSQATGLPVLTSVPTFGHQSDRSVEVLDHPTSAAAEHYQGLLTAIDFASIESPIRSIFFTSAAPGDGKTTTAVNIAALASKYLNVILVDADMRRPSVHQVIGGANSRGLSDVLAGTAEFHEVRQTFERQGSPFDVLTAGSGVKDPALLLRGGAWPELVDKLFLYDMIVIDGPPVLAVTDALLIGRAADAQILIVRSERTARRDLVEAATALAGNGARSIGVVLNREETTKGSYQYYGTYTSTPAEVG